MPEGGLGALTEMLLGRGRGGSGGEHRTSAGEASAEGRRAKGEEGRTAVPSATMLLTMSTTGEGRFSACDCDGGCDWECDCDCDCGPVPPLAPPPALAPNPSRLCCGPSPRAPLLVLLPLAPAPPPPDPTPLDPTPAPPPTVAAGAAGGALAVPASGAPDAPAGATGLATVPSSWCAMPPPAAAA